jgi:hypothetical protein
VLVVAAYKMYEDTIDSMATFCHHVLVPYVAIVSGYCYFKIKCSAKTHELLLLLFPIYHQISATEAEVSSSSESSNVNALPRFLRKIC